MIPKHCFQVSIEPIDIRIRYILTTEQALIHCSLGLNRAGHGTGLSGYRISGENMPNMAAHLADIRFSPIADIRYTYRRVRRTLNPCCQYPHNVNN